jgi:hypothetical protein
MWRRYGIRKRKQKPRNIVLVQMRFGQFQSWRSARQGKEEDKSGSGIPIKVPRAYGRSSRIAYPMRKRPWLFIAEFRDRHESGNQKESLPWEAL